MNKRIVHDALILTAFTLILGLLVGGVYGITRSSIEEADKKTKEEAYKKVFDQAASFEALEGFDREKATQAVSGTYAKDEITDAQVAYDSEKKPLGYVITVKAKDGSQGSITFAVGIRNDGTVNGYSITETGETPGLGLKASEEAFYSQFQNKLVDAFSVVKQTPSSDEEIEAITGSTITSKAMANGCNAAILYFKSISGGDKQ